MKNLKNLLTFHKVSFHNLYNFYTIHEMINLLDKEIFFS